MKLSDIKTLNDIATENNISVKTLQGRLNLKSLDMIEGEDYKKLGKRMPTLLSPQGIEKILNINVKKD